MSNYHTRAKNKSHNYIKSMRLNKETDKINRLLDDVSRKLDYILKSNNI
jgi:hypothetical protein